jgi:hypothetical protein
MTGTRIAPGDGFVTKTQKMLAQAIQLQHFEDMRSILLVLFYHVLVVTRWQAGDQFAAENPILSLVWFSAIACFSFIGATITHNW